jgi:hypothetical protein
VNVREGAEIVVVREFVGRLQTRPFKLGLLHARLNRTDNARRDAILQTEHIVQRAVELVGPDVRAARCVDQLAADADAIAGLTHRALEDVADAKLPAYFADVDHAAFVREGRVARDDKEPSDAAQRRYDVFCNPVGKILLLGFSTPVDERQHGDRGPIGKCKRGARGSHSAMQAYSIGSHRSTDIFELPLADVLVAKINPPIDLFVDFA